MTGIAIPTRRFWPAALVKHERELDELEIPRIPRKEPPCTPTVKGTQAIMAQPSYWRGAIDTRQTLKDTGRGLLLCAQIERDLIAGKGLGDAFREWREGVR